MSTESFEGSHAVPKGKIALIGLAALVFQVGAALVAKHYLSPRRTVAAAPAQTQVAAPNKTVPPLVELRQIGDALRTLQEAAEKYRETHPGKTVHYSDLVGSDKLIRSFAQVSEETYPQEYPPGRFPIAKLPGEITVVLNSATDQPRKLGPQGEDLMPGNSRHLLAAPEVALQQFLDVYTMTSALKPYSIVPREIAVSQTPMTVEAYRLAMERDLMSNLSQQGLTPGFKRLAVGLLEKSTQAKPDREQLLRIIGTRNKGAIYFLLELADSPVADLREAVVRQLCPEDRRGDQPQLLPVVWRETNSPHVLPAVARAMALSGDADCVKQLLLAVNTNDQPRADLARSVLSEIHSSTSRNFEAVPPLAVQLANHPDGPDAKLVATALTKIVDEDASLTVLKWIENSGEDLTEFIQTLGKIRPKHRFMRAASSQALDPSVTFVFEKNRDAIRAYLAPPVVRHPLANGSFENGSLFGFTYEGDVSVTNSWKHVEPTDQQFMAFLSTMGNARDGSATLTSDPFEVPAGTMTLLFDYYFCSTALFRPIPEVLEFHILTATSDVRADVPSSSIKQDIDAPFSGFDSGTKFITGGISVKRWAGTKEAIRLKVILRGRGKLPEHIPGTNLFDANPVSFDKNQGTALFLDNLRLSENKQTSVPPIDPRAVSIKSDRQADTITVKAAAAPLGATLNIMEITSGQSAGVDVQADAETIYRQPYEAPYDETNHFYLSYSTSGADGNGRMISPTITLHVDRPARE